MVEDRKARSSRQLKSVRGRWWLRRCAARNLRPIPVTIAKLELAGALLKRGRYRLGPVYLYALKWMHITAQLDWTQAHAVALQTLSDLSHEEGILWIRHNRYPLMN